MKLTIAASTTYLFVASAVAQDCLNVALSAIPSCAQSCFLDGAPQVGCGGTDFACQCNQEAALYAAIEECVASGCPQPSYQAVIDGASSVCNCATAVFALDKTPGGSMGSFSTTGSFPATGSFTSAPVTTTSGNTVFPPATTPTPTAPATSTPTSGVAPNFHAPQAMIGLFGGAVAAMLV